MTASFAGVNLNGISGLLSGVFRCWGEKYQVSQFTVANTTRVTLMGGYKPTTMRASLRLCAESENVRVGAVAVASLDTRQAVRTAVRIRNGVSLLARAARRERRSSKWRGQLADKSFLCEIVDVVSDSTFEAHAR